MHQKSLKQIAVNLAGAQVGGRLVRFGYMVVVARMLGPTETGVYLYGMALYLGVLGLGLFGQHLFILRRIGSGNRVPHFPARHSLTIIVGALVAVVVPLLAFVLVTEPDPRYRAAVLAFVGALVARVIVIWVRNVYVATGEVGWVPRYETAFRGLEAALGIIMLSVGWGLVAISYLHFLCWSLEAYAVLRKVGAEHPGWLGFGRRRRYLARIVSISTYLLVGHAAISLFPQVSVILLRQLQPDERLVGQFGIALQFLTAALIVPMTFTQAFLPRLSRAWRFGDGGYDLITAAKVMSLACAAVAILGHAYAPFVISKALGPSYETAASVFSELIWVLPPFSIVFTVSQALNIIGAQRAAAGIVTMMLAIHITAMLAFLSHAPLQATIGSMLAAAIVAAAVSLWFAGRQIGEPGQCWWLRPSLIAAVCCGIAVSSWAPAIFSAPAALGFEAILVVVFKALGPRDVTAIRRVLGLRVTDSPEASLF